MRKDPIVESVRRSRERIFARFGYDLARYAEHLRQQARKSEIGKSPAGSAGSRTRKPARRRRPAA